MSYINVCLTAILLCISAGCASLDCKPTAGKALAGTEKAIVGIYIDKNGYPQATVDTVNVYPGQKIVFIGPEKFDIFFKNQNSPIRELEVRSNNELVTIEIPKDIFEREQRSSKAADLKELRYNYGIRANGKVTDPEIIVTRR